MKTYIINLARNHERWELFKAKADKLVLDYERFDAVDGRTLSEEQINAVFDAKKAKYLGNILGQGEIGCALSHAMLYHKIAEEGIPYCLIMEDDSLPLAIVPDLLEEIPEYIKPEDNSVIMLWDGRGCLDEMTRFTLPKTQLSIIRTHAPYSTVSYLVTYEAARRLAQFLPPIVSVADSWKRFEDYGLVKVWQVVPSVIALTELEKETTIEHHDPRHDKKLVKKVTRRIRHLFVGLIEGVFAFGYRRKMGYRL